MKKLICIILVVMLTTCLFAKDSYVTSTEEGQKAEDLLKEGLYKNEQQLRTIAPLLTPAEIALLYDKSKESPITTTLLNGIIGLGVGSFVAGDTKGGWIQLGLEGGGAILAITSFGYFITYGVTGIIDAIFGKEDDKTGIMIGAASVGMIAGVGAFIGGRFYGIVRGVKYPRQYNRDLEKTLYGNSGSQPKLSFTPICTPSGIGFGIGVRF